ncbi:uncharacterized protein LOC112501684 [Cynara cardunculus var. scolymus]|uniref:uncharacterized protein LOC112501684 n=1 Tax=Cynara cardunculus var. scolymus TaxID=59895 RepID=UPI000D62B64E|nr:uncharacterized protein LOC112501684 [Cynara cardunculus var. scolymus]
MRNILGILLNKVKGAKLFEGIRTVNGDIFPTFRCACYALGLLDDDKEYVDAIEEASLSGSGFYLRFLFATMLISNSLSRPEFVWQKTWQYLANDILYNQRIALKSPASEVEQTRDFANWILDLGEGKVGSVNDGEAVVDIPHDLLITNSTNPIFSLTKYVYPSILVNINNSSYFQEKAILAPKHEVVQEINDRLLSLFPGDEKECLSSDSLCESEQLHDQFRKTLYSPGVLNGLKLSGLSNHKILLKIGVPIMLLKNIDHKSRLSNGTRLRVLSLGNRVIEAEIISRSNIGS